MSDAGLARRAKAEIAFDGVDITSSMARYLKSLTYTDSEEDEADDLQIVLQDRDRNWLKSWLSAALEGASETIGQGINAPSGEPYTVTARSGLCVRTGPSKTYSRLAVLSCGAAVSVTGWENGWAMVDYNGSTAYVYGGFVSQKGQETQGKSAGAYSALSISAVITSLNRHGDGKDSVLDCGEFELDSLRWQSAETAVTIKGTAIPFTSEI